MKRHIMLAAFVTWLVILGSGQSYSQVNVDAQASLEQLWGDAIHYFKIGRPEIGQAFLKAFLDRKPPPLEVLKLSDKDPRASKILIKLQSDKQLGPLASAALKLIDQGWHQRRRDPKRVAAELERLVGNPRAQFLATNRLVESGEYAVPIIVEYLGNATKAPLHGKIIDVVVKLGQTALESLLVAVQNADGKTKLLIIEALARLDYPQALPYLKQLAEDSHQMASVREAATKAIEHICQRNPKYRTDAGAGEMFYQLGRRYYYRDTVVSPAVKASRLVGDIRAEKPNLWLWRDGKLVNQPVPWEIYYELMAMRMTRRAIELDGRLHQALVLWLMADCKRELRLSDKVADPMHKADFPSCDYFFRSAGTGHCLSALQQSLADKDIAIALKALSALTDIAGGNDILEAIGGAQPIANALNFRHQLIQLWSALALGWSAPDDVYPGVGRVIPLLAKALSGPEKPLAALVVPDQKKSSQIKSALEKLRFEVAAFTSYEKFQKGIEDRKTRIEAIVLDYGLATPGTSQIVRQFGSDALLALVPTMVIAPTGREQEAKLRLKDAAQVAVMPGVPNDQMIRDKLGYLQRQLGRTVPGSEEIRRMAMLSAKALHRLAALNLKNYQVKRATQALIDAAKKNDWELAYECAQILTLLDGNDAQRGLADAGLGKSDVAQKIKMFALLRSSIRRWGSKLSDQQVKQFYQIVKTEPKGQLREAAAAVIGAVNLPPDQARQVILIKEGFGRKGK